MSDDLISRQAAIDVIDKIFPVDPMRNDYTQGITCGAALATEYIKQLPSAQQEDWIEQNKDRILKAGMEGREIEFRIGGRLFAIREKAQ